MSGFVGQWTAGSGATGDQIQAILCVARRYLAMDVGFVSEFVRGDRIFRYTDAEGTRNPISVGASDPIEKSFCHYVAKGIMPEKMDDAAIDPVAATLPATQALPVGSYISVPLRHPDGTAFGSLCCFSFKPDRVLTSQDHGVLRMCADVVCAVLEHDRKVAEEAESRRSRMQRIIASAGIEMVFQPIYQVSNGNLLGFEALSRFPHLPQRSPDVWFAKPRSWALAWSLSSWPAARPSMPCRSSTGRCALPSISRPPRSRARCSAKSSPTCRWSASWWR